MAIFTNSGYEPEDDPIPWGVDFKGDDIETGELDIVEIGGEYVRLDDAKEWLVANATVVNTEE